MLWMIGRGCEMKILKKKTQLVDLKEFGSLMQDYENFKEIEE